MKETAYNKSIILTPTCFDHMLSSKQIISLTLDNRIDMSATLSSMWNEIYTKWNVERMLKFWYITFKDALNPSV
jgi:hypothetical protein